MTNNTPTPPAPADDAKSPFPAPERAAFPSLYCNIYPDLLPVARSLGYALAIHGSVSRDLDLIAVPWTEDARPPEELVEAIRAKFDGWIGGATAGHPFVDKPHGRRAWSIMLGGHAVVDLSVVPVVGAMPADDASVERVIQALGAETGIHRLYAHERMALVRAVLNTRANAASGAEAMRACAKACRDRSRSLYDGKQMAAGLEASKCADMIDALLLPAPDDAVEKARRAVVERTKAWMARVRGHDAYKTTVALEKSIDALLATERDAALRRENRGDQPKAGHDEGRKARGEAPRG